MKIELEEPFRSKWLHGYIRTSNEGRKIIDLYSSDTNRTTISYARYLMCVHLGYILSDEYEVDHKNDDKTDDLLTNLQVLTKEQNRLKQEYNYIMNQQVVYGVYCAYCQTPFLMTERELKSRLSRGVEYPFCSRNCSAGYNFHISGRINLRLGTLSDEDKQRVKDLRSKGLSSYAIADQTGFSRNTVMKYWN